MGALSERDDLLERAEAAAAAEPVRLAKEQGLSLTGPDGLVKLFTKNVLEAALNEELTEHLGHEKNRASPDRETGSSQSRVDEGSESSGFQQ